MWFLVVCAIEIDITTAQNQNHANHAFFDPQDEVAMEDLQTPELRRLPPWPAGSAVEVLGEMADRLSTSLVMGNPGGETDIVLTSRDETLRKLPSLVFCHKDISSMSSTAPPSRLPPRPILAAVELSRSF